MATELSPAEAEEKLRNNKARIIVDDAYKRKYGVVAACVYNLEGIIATVRAAEAKRSPAMIQLFPWAIEFADGLLLHAAAEAAAKASVPVAVHMDHAQTPEIVRRAADLGGFDGIMVDMSHYEKEENMSLSRELVAYCNRRGIVTECEPGRINGGEDGVADTADLASILTTAEQAEEFVALGIDFLAPAFGNVHGKYGPKGPQLEFDRLDSIVKQVGDRVRIVLHGAHEDHFKTDLMRKCVAHGIAKYNINGVLNNPFLKVAAEKAGKVPLTTLHELQVRAMQDAIEENMDMLMSTGKADDGFGQ